MTAFVFFAVLLIFVESTESRLTPDKNASTLETASPRIEVVPSWTTTGPPFKFGTPTFFGSGCPADTVTIVSSTDGQAVSVLFSQFAARTSGTNVMRDRKSCNLAVPVDVQSVSVVGAVVALACPVRCSN
ncbi:unnamed protein product [Phytophthora fragariaefolia]|uniref:Unnamed protein product n=1 Tax=Phytophthora fragariaefolia TaxID=1490495 RepID=A0A9W6X3T9_9STRA|nr:unnamed protein product [Phytophthora fragariaefolia]